MSGGHVLGGRRGEHKAELEEVATQRKPAIERQTACHNRALERSSRDFEGEKAEQCEWFLLNSDSRTDVMRLATRPARQATIHMEIGGCIGNG
jgi:hypothetical protein